MDKRQEPNILDGKIIICTYPQKTPDDFYDIISNLGAEIRYLPMIEVKALSVQLPKAISAYQWLVFTSKNAVSAFFSQYMPVRENRIAVLGEGTAKELDAFGLKADFIGSGQSAVDFVSELAAVISPGETMLLALGTLAPDTLQQRLSGQYPVDRVNVYQTVMPATVDPELFEQIEQDRYDWLVVTSPSAIKNLHACLKKTSSDLRIISIGETTTAAIRELNLEPLATAATPGYRGLAEKTIEIALKNYSKSGKK
ncbi:uroporphyrinogen-III synthase [Gaoshiqia sp. Z1-71]|uniref:uroporphyrinogen-III synthase n=1 Tax=Gaoshiqia hydrogeniformans TaxID=3290090 RepID=UPI003BF84B0B